MVVLKKFNTWHGNIPMSSRYPWKHFIDGMGIFPHHGTQTGRTMYLKHFNFPNFYQERRFAHGVVSRWCAGSLACIAGTGGIILVAPSLYDTRSPIDILVSKVHGGLRRDRRGHRHFTCNGGHFKSAAINFQALVLEALS
jgi:hypothetical protein